MWELNIKILRKHWGLFSGEKIITIVQGAGMAPPEKVLKYLPSSAEVQFVLNDPVLGEVPHFLPALQTLKNRGAIDGNVFYAHAKGVSVKRESIRYETVRAWTEALYEINLGRANLVDSALQKYKCAGAFKRIGSFSKIPSSDWHFSGNFWWANLKHLWLKDWQIIDSRDARYGIEGYLSGLFTVDESWDFLPKTKWLHPYQRPPSYFKLCSKIAGITQIGERPTFFKRETFFEYIKTQIASFIFYIRFYLESFIGKVLQKCGHKNLG